MSASSTASQFPSQAPQEPPDMPKHWKVPEDDGSLLSSIKILAFRILCLIAITRPSLGVHCWVSKSDDKEWEKHRKMVCDKLNASNIAAGLILTTSAVYLTTQPPPTEMNLLPYTTLASYIFSILSFVQALASMLAGVAVIAVYESCDREWTLKVGDDSCRLNGSLILHPAGPHLHSLPRMLHSYDYSQSQHFPCCLYLLSHGRTHDRWPNVWCLVHPANRLPRSCMLDMGTVYFPMVCCSGGVLGHSPAIDQGRRCRTFSDANPGTVA
ncbi:uncharacterized protein BJ212DRAFT_130221 [Suillus subaureus]|uniref:Uncharacterized protein n=1 Tax=Suillus subaureus TaxID=48587 RepID=A0A9P7ECY4_9AGAM|nr:uncharacterized protein BJ212DRAFT_130221 [Suillus subaureus]KAG1818223.1 hypothetical protein BJ212DRAFT_130221 [Suillus subaureus]